MALDWDILDEDCADISDWTDEDYGGSVSSQETFDSLSCFKFYVPSNVSYGAERSRIIGSIPDTFTYEIKFYIYENNPGTGSAPLYFYIVNNSGHSYPILVYETNFRLYLGSSGWCTITTPSIASGWHTIRLVVKSSRLVDIWLDGFCYLASKQCSHTYATHNKLYLQGGPNYGYNVTVYVDYVRVDTTPEGASSVSPLRIGSENISYRYPQSGSISPSKLRLQGGRCINGGGNEILEIPLVLTSDPNASKCRIYDGSATKSLMKLPS